MSKRRAALDLEWDHQASGDWMADLPAIPGYTGTTGNYSFVTVDPSPTSEDWVCSFTIFVPGKGQAYLSNRDLGIPDAVTGEEMVSAVDALSPEDIADALEALGYEQPGGVVASRRTASLGLEWTNTSEDTWQADLPAIPGYTGADGNDSFVTVSYNGRTELAVPYDAVCTIFLSQGGVVNLNLWDMWSFDPFGPDAKDVMQAVDDLDVYDISHQLEQMGYEPMVDENGEYVVASRRTADLGPLNWWGSNPDDTSATLPNIPGYSPRYGDTVAVYNAANPYMFVNNQSPLTDEQKESGRVWAFDIQFSYPWGSGGVLTNEDFGIPYATSKEEMKDIVENLTVEEIVQAAEENGIEPYKE